MTTNVLDDECCTSNIVCLSSQPNCSSFQDSSTDVVSEATAECVNYCVTPKSKYHIGGGITCCVTTCFNNSVRNKELSFYVIPKDNQQRSKWLSMLRRKNFIPSSSHRVCSVQFVGGKKTYMNNIPTLNRPVPHQRQLSHVQQRIVQKEELCRFSCQ